MVMSAARQDRGRDRPWDNGRGGGGNKGGGRQTTTSFADRVKNNKKKKDGKGKGKNKGNQLPAFLVSDAVKDTTPTLKDGTPLCAAFNEGKCKGKGKGCKNGKHVCSSVKGQNGRACVGPHPAISCARG